MNKAITALVLVLAFSAQPALAGKSGRHAADAPKPKETEQAHFQRAAMSNAGRVECKKYFALIGGLVSVPCTR